MYIVVGYLIYCVYLKVVETSALKCFAESPNKRNKLFMVAEPLEKRIADDLEKGLISDKWDQR